MKWILTEREFNKGHPMKKTKVVRMETSQYDKVKSGAKERDIPFQQCLKRVIGIGIKMTKLGETK
jgi:hypothetical protein